MSAESTKQSEVNLPLATITKKSSFEGFFCYRIAGDLNSEREFENKRKADFRMPVSKADECRVDETK